MWKYSISCTSRIIHGLSSVMWDICVMNWVTSFAWSFPDTACLVTCSKKICWIFTDKFALRGVANSCVQTPGKVREVFDAEYFYKPLTYQPVLPWLTFFACNMHQTAKIPLSEPCLCLKGVQSCQSMWSLGIVGNHGVCL